MKLFNVQFGLFVYMLFLVPVAMAQNTMMSEDSALENFKEAAKLYRQGMMDSNVEEPEIRNIKNESMMEDEILDAEFNVKSEMATGESDLKLPSTIEQADIDAYNSEKIDEYAPIEDIIVAVDLENKTLEQVVEHILNQARDQAGEWNVKWRVSGENSYILSERVNLIAETNLSEFMSYLVDRVNNMTGIQLFVTVFDQSRIIVISDTYY